MTMITPSYLGETIEYSSLHACRSTLEDPTGKLSRVQQAWLEHDVPQCGYCQPGIIMAVAALLKEKPKPTDADIDASITNICRCGTFQQVREAIHAAAKS